MSYTPSSAGPNEASSSKPQVRWANPDAHEAEESEEEDDEDVAMAAAHSYPSGSKSATTSGTTPTPSAYSSAFKTSTYPPSTPGASGSGTSGAQPYVPLSYSNSFLSTTPGSFSFIRSEGVGENYTSGGDMGYSAAPSGGTGDGDDEFLPAMADDDYSALLSWQKQSKDDLKVLMDSLSPEQYDRFEAYRRSTLPKQAVRKVIQQGLGQQVSMPVAQVVAGVAKVFVGEMVERARAVQTRRRETGPLSPDHLREAYRMYQEEFGRVGVAQRVRGKRLFVR